ncbi:MAG: pyridoxamine 5'-phosphate oxidase family protein [Spirochaetaceae bacterium]|jgi:uncharacterized pyridoxamine 5'-phosphate oxidase family protein|nr:pyridoxamine 5'-phosphate oxidase family protein [Spirochaetaceae bacterium]
MNAIQEVFRFFSGKTFYVATVEGDAPRVRPFGFVMEFQDKLYFATNDQKPSFKQLTANPKVEISATDPDSKEWLRLSGKAVFDSRPEVKARAFEVAPFLKQMYDSDEGPALKLFYLAEGEAIFQTLGSPTQKRIAL